MVFNWLAFELTSPTSWGWIDRFHPPFCGWDWLRGCLTKRAYGTSWSIFCCYPEKIQSCRWHSRPSATPFDPRYIVTGTFVLECLCKHKHPHNLILNKLLTSIYASWWKTYNPPLLNRKMT